MKLPDAIDERPNNDSSFNEHRITARPSKKYVGRAARSSDDALTDRGRQFAMCGWKLTSGKVLTAVKITIRARRVSVAAYAAL